MNPTRYLTTTVASLAVTAALLAQAQSVPALVNYQGQLTDAGGAPLATADYALTFQIYDAADGGTLVWGPQVFDGASGPGRGPKIPVVQGYFNVMLGPVDTKGASLANAFNAPTRYVEIKVNDSSAIAPRQQILSAPFALKAASANELTVPGGTSSAVSVATSGKVGIGTASPAATLDVVSPQDEVLGLKGGSTATLLKFDAQSTDDYALGTETSLSGLGLKNLTDNRYSLFVGDSGNIGIGTTAPNQGQLVVVHSDAATSIADQTPGTVALINSDLTAGNFSLLTFNDGQSATATTGIGTWNTAHSAVSTAAVGDLSVFTKPSNSSTLLERMRVTSAGDVGIGTTSPQARLDVAGTLQFGAMAQQSLGPNGYIKLGELIIQWGQEATRHDVVLNNTTTALTFPTPFPNEVLVVVPGIIAEGGGSYACGIAVASSTKTQVTLWWHEWGTANQDVRASYIAIGR